MDGGGIRLSVPDGWSVPNGTPGTPGFTTASSTGSIGAAEFSGQQITIPIENLSTGQTITFNYGAGGGASRAIAQSNPGTAIFEIASLGSAAGTLTTIRDSPTVTVALGPAPFTTFNSGAQLTALDPIGTAVRNYFFTERPDLDLRGLSLQRSYDSAMFADGFVQSALGPNWQHTFELLL